MIRPVAQMTERIRRGISAQKTEVGSLRLHWRGCSHGEVAWEKRATEIATSMTDAKSAEDDRCMQNLDYDTLRQSRRLPQASNPKFLVKGCWYICHIFRLGKTSKIKKLECIIYQQKQARMDVNFTVYETEQRSISSIVKNGANCLVYAARTLDADPGNERRRADYRGGGHCKIYLSSGRRGNERQVGSHQQLVRRSTK